ncbi:MgtC/SapB family protein [Portibacter marinus]|uniref:MgtC/SapB family protein n=1 Tax=Portibacter marinus TaxID=2898660 RepID=UPI001F18323A|nr:MgtC/SapB family protein [Portibacter marinus]
MNYDDLITLGIALGLGLLVGVQRESVESKMAGVRTFTILSILGAISGFLTRDFENDYILPFMAIAVTGLLLMANYIKLKKQEDADIGQTTEVAALLIFAISAYLVEGSRVVGIVVGGSLAFLLYIKEHLHHFIDGLKEKDISAIMIFAGISLVILPILPNQTYGPYDVLNPRNIWMMVTLIVGISVIGYFIYKFVSQKVGIITNGILGGLISSTATSVSYARKTTNAENIGNIAAFVITVASAIALVRIIIEIAVVIPQQLPMLLLPLAVEFIFMVGVCVVMFYLISKEQKKEDKMPEPNNPAQFRSALVFGLLYAFILLVVAFTKDKFGNNALYIVSLISGLTDVDAITLSLSQLMKTGDLSTNTGWKLILLASLSNLLFKGIIAGVLGTRKLLIWICVSFGVSIIAGLLIIWLWPEAWNLSGIWG